MNTKNTSQNENPPENLRAANLRVETKVDLLVNEKKQQAPQRTKHIVILSVFLIFLSATQAAAISARSLWEDEAFSGKLVRMDPAQMLEILANDQHPPLYWIAAGAWSRVAGVSDYSLKAFSVLWLLAACFLLYRLSARVFNQRTGLISVGLFAVSPLVLTYGHSARYYSMAAALALLATWAVFEFLNTNQTRWLLAYTLAGLLLIYTLYMGGALLVALNVWWLVRWTAAGRRLRELFSWAAAQAVILVAYLPWFPIAAGALDRNFGSPPAIAWGLDLISRIAYLAYTFEVGEFFSPLNPIAWLGLIVLTGSFAAGLLRSPHRIWPVLMILTLVAGAGLYVNIAAVYPQSAPQNLSNRLFFVYPFFAIIAGYGLGGLKRNAFLAAAAAILLVTAGAFFNYFNDRQVLKPILTVPWREIMADIDRQAAPDAVRICTNNDVSCTYYLEFNGHPRLTSVPNLLPASQPLPEIWWIQVHVGGLNNPADDITNSIEKFDEQYRLVQILQYAPHDPEIADLKARYLGSKAYDFRVEVHQFQFRDP